MASRYHFQTNARPTLGADIGSALGTGLGKGLTALAETKLNSMLSRQRQAADKQKLVSLGIADHEAEYLSHQDPDTQWQAARAWLVAGGAPDKMLPKQLGDPFNITPEQEMAAREQLGINQPQEQQQPIQGPKTAADFITQQGPMSPQIRQALEGMKLPQGQPEQGASAAMQSIAPQQPMQQPQMQEQIAQSQMQPQQQRPKSLGEAFRIEQQMKKGGDRETAELKKELLKAQIEKTKQGAKEETGQYLARPYAASNSAAFCMVSARSLASCGAGRPTLSFNSINLRAASAGSFNPSKRRASPISSVCRATIRSSASASKVTVSSVM